MNDKKIIEKINNRIMDFMASDNPDNLTLGDLFIFFSLEDLKIYYKYSEMIDDKETVKMLKPIIDRKSKKT